MRGVRTKQLGLVGGVGEETGSFCGATNGAEERVDDN